MIQGTELIIFLVILGIVLLVIVVYIVVKSIKMVIGDDYHDNEKPDEDEIKGCYCLEPKRHGKSNYCGRCGQPIKV